ncbi:aspartyl protease family protein [Altererythrobacter atlanticus]|uniref:Uncharacterized protein n=1 Tax=Croceibacterium atlanticum TaxID=1267766 RepID=A0A0F7KTT5_9SPHN|nr:TIGR02281 family clan AA aspartic protease [Croceibacterium atlanticum]AKH42657.1 hypothetical protein WYH_01621 [Croceibacterium atlanticum]MBB5731434.1 aspartyl protease family protein [Croceibacterium atlanticum]
MKFAPVILLLAAAGLVGWFYPELAGPGGDDVQAQQLAGKAADADPRPEPSQAMDMAQKRWNAGEIVLPRAADGHFYAEVTVDGVPARMLVDTGATVIALTGADAQAMGHYWTPQDLRPIGRGAGGQVQGVPIVLDRVELGGIEAQRIRAIIVPEGLPISLLGQSFLSQVRRVEIDSSGMILGS